MAKDKMTDDELLSQIREEVAAADYSGTNELSFQREQSTRAYNGVLTDGLQPTTGMSSIVNNKIQPTVETLTTYLTKIFCSDIDTVVFSANSDNMLPVADQTTKLVNHIIHKKNDGYKIINRWIKDAAINKNGIVKIVWDEMPSSFKEEFEGTEESFNILLSEKESQGYECEILEKEKLQNILEVTDEEAGEVVEVKEELMRFVIKCTKMKGMPKIVNVPPEEFLINEGATDINGDIKTRFVCQRQMMSLSDIKKMFPDADIEDLRAAGDSTGYGDHEYERLNRHAFDGTYDYTGTDPSQGPNREIVVIESWIKADYDGDGISEMRHTISAGQTMLLNEEWFGEIPFASFCFFPIPHKFYGLSVYDKLQWYHRASSMLLRSEIDTRLLQNTYRIIANPNNVDMRDLQSGRPGIIKARPGFESKDIQILPAPGGAGNTAQILDYLHKEIVGQIGIDPNTGAISSDVEKSGNDAAKTSQVVDNASAKIEQFAREFAETGLRDVIWQITKLLIEHSYDDSIKMLVSKITPDNPTLLISAEDMQEYFDKDDLTAKVGLGHQTTQQKLQGAQAILSAQNALESSPVAPTPIPYKYKQAANMELTKALGFEDANKYFPSPEEVQAEQQRIQQQQAQALQLQMQQSAVVQQEQMANNEADRILKDAQAMKAKVEAEGAQRKQQLEEEAKVVEIENTKEDNALNIRRQKAQEEQMASNIDMQQKRLDLDTYKAEEDVRLEETQERSVSIQS